jgi:hypothetical protein
MPRVRKELVDMDYLKDLSEKDRQWIEKFSREYYGGSLNTESPRKNLHKSKAKIKECFDRNNKQNNDLFGVTKANNLLDHDIIYKKVENTEYIHPSNVKSSLTEEALIAYIDNKELLDCDEKEFALLIELLEEADKED